MVNMILEFVKLNKFTIGYSLRMYVCVCAPVSVYAFVCMSVSVCLHLLVYMVASYLPKYLVGADGEVIFV